MKILVVEDEVELCNSVTEFLNQSGFVCDCANNCQTALDLICEYDYSLIVLDIILPDGNGLDIVKHIKENNINSGLIIVSAKNALEDKIEGLNLGADDYITKPFALSELLARAKALIRRKDFDGNTFVEIGNTKIEPENHSVFINNQPIKFSKKEFQLLSYFFSNQNKVLSKFSLAEHIWGNDALNNSEYFDFLYSQIKNIKKKLKSNNSTLIIETVYGIGYKLVEK